jgi:hypothetical protein
LGFLQLTVTRQKDGENQNTAVICKVSCGQIIDDLRKEKVIAGYENAK